MRKVRGVEGDTFMLEGYAISGPERDTLIRKDISKANIRSKDEPQFASRKHSQN
jgi:hypothetical protein